MVHVHTELPRHAGERSAAERLIAIADAETHVWFSVNYLPGVSDLDALILHEEIGVFAVEIKAVFQEMIVEYGPDRCVIKDRHGTRTPLQQARTSQLALIDYLRDVQGMDRPPFIHLTALWPKIHREAFTTQWAHPTVEAQAGVDAVAEDLADQDELVSSGLRHMVKRPAYGRPRSTSAAPTPQQVGGSPTAWPRGSPHGDPLTTSCCAHWRIRSPGGEGAGRRRGTQQSISLDTGSAEQGHHSGPRWHR